MNQETRAYLGMLEYAQALMAAIILGPEGIALVEQRMRERGGDDDGRDERLREVTR